MEDPKVALCRMQISVEDPPFRFGNRWTVEEEARAMRDYNDGIPIELIAKRLGRSIYRTRLRVVEAVGKWKTHNRQGFERNKNQGKGR